MGSIISMGLAHEEDNEMKIDWKVVALSGLVFAITANAQSTRSFAGIGLALRAVTQGYHIATGFEKAIGDSDVSPIAVDLSGNDVARVLDSLIAQRPSYTWNLEDGVYDIYPKGDNLSQVMVRTFLLTNGTLGEARNALLNLPEFEKWYLDHRTNGRNIISDSHLAPGRGAPPAAEPKRVSLTLNDVQVRTILNQLIAKFDRPSWSMAHEGEKGERVSVQF